jgi:hypothetical protein
MVSGEVGARVTFGVRVFLLIHLIRLSHRCYFVPVIPVHCFHRVYRPGWVIADEWVMTDEWVIHAGWGIPVDRVSRDHHDRDCRVLQV